MASLLLSISNVGIAVIIAVVVLLTISILFLITRYKKCPADKIMVIYGKVRDRTGKGIAFKCIHGGAALVMPLIQSYAFLDLNPISISIDLRNSFSDKKHSS